MKPIAMDAMQKEDAITKKNKNQVNIEEVMKKLVVDNYSPFKK